MNPDVDYFVKKIQVHSGCPMKKEKEEGERKRGTTFWSLGGGDEKKTT